MKFNFPGDIYKFRREETLMCFNLTLPCEPQYGCQCHLRPNLTGSDMRLGSENRKCNGPQNDSRFQQEI